MFPELELGELSDEVSEIVTEPPVPDSEFDISWELTFDDASWELVSDDSGALEPEVPSMLLMFDPPLVES